MTEQGSPPDRVLAFIGASIHTRRERLGLSVRTLADKVCAPGEKYLSSADIIAIELGVRNSTAFELAKIAQALLCDFVDLFEQPNPPPAVAWRERTLDHLGGAQARFVRARKHYQAAEQWLGIGTKLELPRLSVPHTLSDDWADNAASMVGGQLDLGDVPARRLRRVLEEDVGVKVLVLRDFGGSAACFYDTEGAAVVLDARNDRWRQNFSLAHELFHLASWPFLSPSTIGSQGAWSKDIEALADRFASSLLLPRDSLYSRVAWMRSMPRQPWLPRKEVIGLADEFEVSASAVLKRLVYIGVMNSRTAQALESDREFQDLKRASNRTRRAREQDIDRFTALVTMACSRGYVTQTRAAEMLDMPQDEMGHLLTRVRSDPTWL